MTGWELQAALDRLQAEELEHNRRKNLAKRGQR